MSTLPFCPNTDALHRHLADEAKAEAFAEAVSATAAENEAETYSEENIVMAIEAIQNDESKWVEFCEALRNVNYNRIGVMLDTILNDWAEDRAAARLKREAA